MTRLPILSTGEAFDEARQQLKQHKDSYLLIAVVKPDQDQVISILTTDNSTVLANAASNFVQLAIESAGNCPCENCALAVQRCREAIKAWPDFSNVLPFRRS